MTCDYQAAIGPGKSNFQQSRRPMKGDDRKAAIAKYKERKTVAGICAVPALAKPGSGKA